MRIFLMALLLSFVSGTMAGNVPPCDKNATSEVHAVLEQLHAVMAAGKIVTGQVESDSHDDSVGGSRTFTHRDWDTVFNITGEHPGIWGSQFLWGNTAWAQPFRQAMVDRAVELWTSPGGLYCI